MDFQTTNNQTGMRKDKSYLYAVAAQNRPDPQGHGENGSML